ncbi:kinase-like protein [Aspergillus ellipticus CBS 707.79]|uniref:Kinase-like protein n=1 Tax=Aspergillus ellipticus CBS 707.79 TaxID=1448320 RepID=A0A319D6V1_9EURO|nr:kinase-like protein [Aspergillus ellipticus CBS 707.79]
MLSSEPQSSPRPQYRAGTLSRWDPVLKTREDTFPIYCGEDFYVGRDQNKCRYVLDEEYISRKHLHIYTVMVDPDNPEETPPLVYAEDVSKLGTSWNGYSMMGKGGYLLCDGDVLELPKDIFLKFRLQKYADEDDLGVITKTDMNILGGKYTLSRRKLGAGGYGQVYMAYHKKSGRQLACKIIGIRRMRDEIVRKNLREITDESSDLPMATENRKGPFWTKFHDRVRVIKREIMLLKDLVHPNIISIEKVLQTGFNIYIFQELVPGGDLFSYIHHKGGKLRPVEAAVIVRQILIALQYLHERNIVHRDLKPDNILMTSLADGCRVVLTDFGCAIHATGRMGTMVGTFEYTAPEILASTRRGGYTKAVDMWSLGCVTAALLTGRTSIDGSTETYATDLAKRGGYQRLEASLRQHNVNRYAFNVNRRAHNFVKSCLAYDASNRITAAQGLAHCWFTNYSHQEEFENLYQRSIRNWQPCHPDEPLIVDISSTMTFIEDENDSDEEMGKTDLEARSLDRSPQTRQRSSSYEPAIHLMPSPTLSDEDYSMTRDHLFDESISTLKLRGG